MGVTDRRTFRTDKVMPVACSLAPHTRRVHPARTGRAVAFTLLALFTSGCSSRPQAQPTSSAEDEARAILREAPQDWRKFLTWARKILLEDPQPVPLPDSPELPEPHWPVQRLTDAATFRRAVKEPARQRKARSPRVLLEIGPFRSDRPTPTFSTQVARKATEDGRDALKLIMGGFEVDRDQVGMIELELTVPFGRYVMLQWTEAGQKTRWSRAGQLLVPVPTHERFKVPVSTAGMVEWSGLLGALALVTDGMGEGVIEVHRVRFISRSDAFPDAVGLKNRTRVGRELRPALYMHGSGRIRFTNLLLPEDAVFQSGLAVVGSDADEADGRVEFTVYVEHDGQQQRVLKQVLVPQPFWQDMSASLAAWGGQNVTLTLEVRTDTPDTIGLWGAPQVYQPVSDPPLLIIYLIDTLASEHIQLYGYARPTMPTLTALAQRGTWFANMLSNSSRTVESIPDLMLSMTTERHGVHHNLTPVPHELVTLAEILQAAGFATSSYITNVYSGPRANLDQGFDHLVDKIGFFWTQDRELADRTVPLPEVLRWVDARRDRPMFLYIHTAEPHAPYTPPPNFAGRFDPNYRGAVDGTYGPRGFHRAIRDPVRQRRDVQHVAALYDEEVAYSDERLSRLLAALKERGLLEKTNLVVIADHGEEFLQHGAWEHGLNLHNEQTHVPLVMVGPLFGQHGRIDVPAQIVDIMPTLLDLLDLPEPYPLLGRSLAPLLRSEPMQPTAAAAMISAPPTVAGQAANDLQRRTLFGSNHNYRAQGIIEYYALRDGRWKLLFAARGGGRFLLYDVQNDPRERRNVIEQNRALARSLIEELIVWRRTQRPYRADVVSIIDTDQIEQLRALGYVGDAKGDQPPATPN